MEIRRAKEKDMDRINELLRQVCMVHHKGRPDLFQGNNNRKYTDILTIYVWMKKSEGSISGKDCMKESWSLPKSRAVIM